MFGGLRDNSVIYLLDKSNRPALRIGQLATKSNVYPKYGQNRNQYNVYQPNSEQVIDITVKTNDGDYTFKGLPTGLNIANSGNMVVSDNRDAMLAEIEGMRRISQDALDGMPYHQGVVESCDEMNAMLNPQVKRDKENEERIGAMEQRIGGIEGTLSDMKEMLVSALRTSKSGK